MAGPINAVCNSIPLKRARKEAAVEETSSEQ
jgi:hypothetical protein